MLTSIGRKARASDLVGLLLECHGRIRSFLGVAIEVARRDDLPDLEVTEACAQCERYFAEALPLHVEDEEQSLLPRLTGLRTDVDAALQTMHVQHAEHVPLIAELLVALGAVRCAPMSPKARSHLLAVATELRQQLEQHLALEERVLFPALGELVEQAEQAKLVAELRQRRQPT